MAGYLPALVGPVCNRAPAVTEVTTYYRYYIVEKMSCQEKFVVRLAARIRRECALMQVNHDSQSY